MDRTSTPLRATAVGLILAASLTGCSSDPVDLAPTFASSRVSTDQTGSQPEARWAVDRTGVVVTYETTLLAPCSFETSATIKQVDEHNFTLEFASTFELNYHTVGDEDGFGPATSAPGCNGDWPTTSIHEFVEFPDEATPEGPIFLDLSFPDTERAFEFTLA